MRTQRKFNPVWLALTMLVLASMACVIGQDNVSVNDQPALATPAEQPQQPAPQQPQQPTPQQSPVGAGLSAQQRAGLISSEVRLLAMFPDGNDYSPKWSGSGTIVTPDGYILTNAHVAKPSTFGTGEEDPSFMVVGLVEQEDKAPVYSYAAEVVAADGFLDLALLHIIGTMDGNKVNPGELNLPYADLGNSDEMHVGDHISIFGFPGIGGETITFTSGSFGGWTSEDQVGDRAWMKLDATIAGGNSGGMVADDTGHIVGVPTQGGSGAGGNITDCRVIQDTNGDGVVDDKDTCIPFGGFINAARPINLAKGLILAAKNAQDYVSPFNIAGGGGGNAEPGSGKEKFGPVTWVSLDSKGKPQEQVDSFPSGIEVIAGSFEYSGMTDGQDWGMIWYYEGKEAGKGKFQWQDGPEGTMTVSFSSNDKTSLPDGKYLVELYAGTGDQIPLLSQGEVTVGGGGLAPRPGKNDGIQVTGTIVDNDTQRGIKGALFVVLNPGVTFKKWQSENFPDSMVFTSAETDSRGEFSLPDLLQREVSYDIVVAAEGYKAQVFQEVAFKNNDPAEQQFTIPLTQR
jgi:serine protease Do